MKKIYYLFLFFLISMILTSCASIETIWNIKNKDIKYENIGVEYIDGKGLGHYKGEVYFMKRINDHQGVLSKYDLKNKIPSVIENKNSPYGANQGIIYENKLYYYVVNENNIYELWEMDLENLNKKRLFYTNVNNIEKTYFYKNNIYYFKSDILEKGLNIYEFNIKTSSESIIAKNIKDLICLEGDDIYYKKNGEDKKNIDIYELSLLDYEDKIIQTLPKDIDSWYPFYDFSIYRFKNNIYKHHFDGRERVLLIEKPKFFIVNEDQIIYSKLNSINIFNIYNKEEERLLKESSYEMIVYQNKLYYMVEKEGIYEFDLQSRKRIKLFKTKDFKAKNLWVSDYFISYDDEIIKDSKLIQFNDYDTQ